MIIGVSGRSGSGKDLVGQIIQYLTSSFDGDNDLPFVVDDDYSVGNNWKIIKFADKLKDIVCILLGCTRLQLEDRVFKETELGKEWWYFKGRNGTLIQYNENSKRSDEDLIKPTPRLLLQLIGTECGRQIIHPNVWVNATMKDYKSLLNKYDKNSKDLDEGYTYEYPDWIITDCRFSNEAKSIKDRDGIIIRVNRPKKYNTGNPITDKILERTKNFGEQLHESETSLDDYEFDYVVENNGTIEDLIVEVKEILIKEKII